MNISATKFKGDKINFWGEQDGPMERELKAELVVRLTDEPSIAAAYLVRVSYDDSSEVWVALCFNGGSDNAERIVQSAGDVFYKMFNHSQALDMMFLTHDQVSEISRVSTAFYTKLA